MFLFQNQSTKYMQYYPKSFSGTNIKVFWDDFVWQFFSSLPWSCAQIHMYRTRYLYKYIYNCVYLLLQVQWPLHSQVLCSSCDSVVPGAPWWRMGRDNSRIPGRPGHRTSPPLPGCYQEEGEAPGLPSLPLPPPQPQSSLYPLHLLPLLRSLVPDPWHLLSQPLGCQAVFCNMNILTVVKAITTCVCSSWPDTCPQVSIKLHAFLLPVWPRPSCCDVTVRYIRPCTHRKHPKVWLIFHSKIYKNCDVNLYISLLFHLDLLCAMFLLLCHKWWGGWSNGPGGFLYL